MKPRLGIAVALLALAAPAPALAKETTRVRLFPAHPRAGRPVTLQLRTYLYLGGTDLRPQIVEPTHRWEVDLLSRTGTGQTVPVHLARNPRNPFVWSAKVRFASSGWWTVYRGADDPPQDVRVRPRGPLSVWERLERPLHTPTVARGDACPTTAPDSKGDLSRIGFRGTAWGEGPAYPVLDADAGEPLVYFNDPIPPSSLFYGSAWSGNKVLWAFDPIYSGPVLIRGLQVDGGNEVRFDDGRVPPLELKTRSAGIGGRPSFTRVRTAGCYAYEIDGTTFSYTIVFEAKPSA